MIPQLGPVIYVPRGFANAIVPAAGQIGPLEFRFPRAVFVTGLLVMPSTGATADQGALSIQIEDETFQQIIGDGQGQSFDAPALALSGLGPSGLMSFAGGWTWFALQRPVADGDLWNITVFNSSLAEIAVTALLRFDEPEAHAA